ncbi:lipopolysaccharide biosynthesis protein [Collinsella sp. HCP28S3_E12]|uniref:lipopolysaccharide biosynthesis protein n=1 Tax=Collinsella sp. HCP28S3_E12 TaxID=3438921 RepID=UPI003F89985B
MNYKSLVSNALVAFTAQGISFVASIAMSLLVPKVLGVAAYGYWQLFIFYASYSGFFTFGLNDGIYLLEGGNSRDKINKKGVNTQFRFGLLLQLLIAVCITAIAVIWAPEQQRIFVLLSFSAHTLLYNLWGFLGFVFQAMNETKLFSFSLIIERIFFLVAVLALFFMGTSFFEPYVIAYILSKVCSFSYCLINARDFLNAGSFAFPESMKASFSSMKVGFKLMISNIASMLILGVGRALVDGAWGIEAFGKVSFWLSMVSFFIAFVSQASMVLFPALRQGSDSERRIFYRRIRDLMEMLLPAVYILYFPIATVLSLWLSQYADSMHYFAILLPVCVFDTKMDLCCTTYFKVLREERMLLEVNLLTFFGSALISFIGVYFINSLDAVLIGMVLCIICRSYISERYLDTRLDIPSTRVSAQEIALTCTFVLLVLSLPFTITFVIYLVVYAIYLAANRELFRSLLGSLKGLLSHRG